ncbi:MAG: hypothetical protein NT123_05415 [Proteobacteria bacterium]|nr:hypothetical protein [Pseudomonadota bacterium]
MSILRRRAGWPVDRYSEIAPEWSGGTAVLLGGGPGLTVEQVENVRGAHEAGVVRVIAINDAYRLAPWADVCYFADSEWWGWHKDRPAFRAFAGQKCSISDSGANITDKDVYILRNAGPRGISTDPGMICSGRNSGYQALNIAILAGTKTVILLGFDAREPTADRKSHWFGDHPRVEPVAVYAEYRKAFSAAEVAITAAGVQVLNCSPGSAIDAFPKMALVDALRLASAAANP